VLPDSPVIDLGSNPLSLDHDERGLPRTVGLKPDMGAYERQLDDDQVWYDGLTRREKQRSRIRRATTGFRSR
jgi:hypothetical protein